MLAKRLTRDAVHKFQQPRAVCLNNPWEPLRQIQVLFSKVDGWRAAVNLMTDASSQPLVRAASMSRTQMKVFICYSN